MLCCHCLCISWQGLLERGEQGWGIRGVGALSQETPLGQAAAGGQSAGREYLLR